MKKSLLLLSMMLMVTFAWSQRVIKGQVTEAGSKETIIGANVVAKGTRAGTTTDVDGNYTLTVPKEATQIEVSYVGMGTQTITLGASNTIDVVMKGDKALEEVVVVGYGTQKRKDLTGSITSITSENFVKGAIQTPEQLVSGKVAGVQITSNGGAPGGGSTIRIRGGSSLTASNDPLIVIDGVPVDNGTINGAANPLSFVNPADIESITVLKDASSTAIYGSRAANGVIMIVTKKGSSGKMKINISTLLSLGQPAKYASVFSGNEYRALVQENAGYDKAKLLGTANTDWQKEIFRNATSQDHNFTFSGTQGKFPYRVSYNNSNQNGILKNSSMLRNALSAGISPKFFNNSLKVDVNYKVAQIKNQFADQGAIGNAISFDPTQSVYDRENPGMGGYFEWLNNGSPNALSPRNPVALLNLKKDGSTVVRQIGNIQFDYAIPFVKNLRANLNIGFDKAHGDGAKYTTPSSAAAFNNGGYEGAYAQNKLNKLMEVYLSYNKQLGSNSKLDFIAGHSYQSFYNEARGYDRDLGIGNGKAITRRSVPDTSKIVLISFFGRAVFNLQDKYIFTGTVREDASSRFSPETRWGLFPSFAVAWKINEEGFMKNLGLFSDLKLRAGYGITGQQDVGGAYGYLPNYTLSETTTSYQFGNQYVRTLRPEAYSPNKWETTTTTNVALDYGFAKGKIYGSIDVYNRLTSDLLAEVPVPAGANLKNRIVTNAGSLTNKGVEFSINFNPISNEKTNWTFGFNVTSNQNKITALTKYSDPNAPGIETGGIAGGVGNNIQFNKIGSPVSSFYVYKQVYNTAGKPIEGLFEDLNGDGKITPDDRYIYKSPAPAQFYGFSTQFSHKNFNTGFTLRSNVGSYMYNNIFSNGAVYEKISTAEGFVSNISTNVSETGFNKINAINSKSDYFMENASFLRMDNIYVSYILNDKRDAESPVTTTISFNIQNAFVITKYKGIDPEIFNGIDNNFYPRARTYSLGLNIGF